MPESTGIAIQLNDPGSILEKITKLRYFLLLTSFLLALDIALVLFFQKNILSFGRSLESPEITTGNAILFITVFSFLLSLFFPAVRLVLQAGLLSIYCKWLINIYKPSSDSVLKYACLVKHDALMERDEFDYKRAVEHEESEKKKEATLRLAFSAALLFVIDYFVGTQNVHSIIQILEIYLKSMRGFWGHLIASVMYITFTLTVAILALVSLNPVAEDKMYLPKPDDNKPKNTFPKVSIDTTVSILDTKNPNINETN